MKPLALAAPLLLLAAPALSADWSERDICRAGIQSFFALPVPPRDHPKADFRDYMGFQGRNGIITRDYACRIQKNRIAIRWFVEGHRKRHAKQKWHLDGDVLVVTLDGAARRFGE